MACNVVSNLENCAKDVSPRPQPNCPRPREDRVIKALINGAPTLSAAMKEAGFKADSSAIRERFERNGDLAERLQKEMSAAGITLESTLKVLSGKLDAKSPVTFKGEICDTTDDNQAQLRAVDTTLDLLERAGQIPGKAEAAAQGTNITVNVIAFNSKR